MANPDWVKHAYPLQQISIQLQGTRHNSRAEIIDQLELVLACLRAGESVGEDHDDDFGYRFEVNGEADRSFFDQTAGRRP